MKFRLREFIPSRKRGKIIKREMMFFEDIRFELVRKSMRSINIRITPPDGDVRVSAPLKAGISEILSFVESRAGWIRKHRDRLKKIPRPEKIHYINGDRIKFLGKEYMLRVIDSGRSGITIEEEEMTMKVPEEYSALKRKEVIERFYRKRLAEIVPKMIEYWEPVMNVKVNEYGIKKMKTRWGTCNIRDKRIWINLQLAQTSTACLEMIIVHEMTHLLERNHTKRFYKLMDKFIPDWRDRKKELDSFTNMLVD